MSARSRVSRQLRAWSRTVVGVRGRGRTPHTDCIPKAYATAPRCLIRPPSFLGARRGAHSERWPGSAPARAAFPSADRQRASAPTSPDAAGRSQAARPRPRPPPARSRPTAPPAAAGAGAASPPPPLAAARSGPLRHLRSRPIDPARGAVGSEAHGPPSRACFARSARVVPLVPTLLRRAVRSSPVVTGRTERRKIEGAGSRHRWALDTPGRIAAGAPSPPLSRGSAARPARARSQRRVQTWLQALQGTFPSYSIWSVRT